MSRLTVRNFENETCCAVGGCIAYEDCYECPGFQDILAKLAHYEDLEEAGRLVILPEAFGKEKFIYSNCLSYIGLKSHCNGDCKGCWEAALKGAE